MDPTLIALLAFCLLFAVGLHYFIHIRPALSPGPWGKAGIFILLSVMVPVIVTTLVLQAGAAQRLGNTGFVLHPEFSSSRGLAVGIGDQPTWVFASHATPESIRAFYEQPENRRGWMPAIYTGTSLRYKRDGFSMSILIDRNQVVFALLREPWPE